MIPSTIISNFDRISNVSLMRYKNKRTYTMQIVCIYEILTAHSLLLCYPKAYFLLFLC